MSAMRLLRSIRRLYPEISITFYTDDKTSVYINSQKNFEVKILPEISQYGVKRAKFFAYKDAAQGDGFVYLDSDIVVVNRIDSLINALNQSQFTACRDDLSECAFIENKHHPWPNHPSLSARYYFNSGVFAAPSELREMFSEMAVLASSDEIWNSYVVKGKLLDNHFICGLFATYNIDVSFISEFAYNWQGFRKGINLNCYIDPDGDLRNSTTNEILRLVHFAGVSDVEAFVRGLPASIVRLLARCVSSNFNGFLEAAAAVCASSPMPDDGLTVLASLSSPISDNWNTPGEERQLLPSADKVTSVALSTCAESVLWNNLKCGAAYLSAQEYAALRDFIVARNITSVLEFGAGYTTALFRNLGCHVFALEPTDGPWLKVATDNGADARLCEFNQDRGFDPKTLHKALKETLRKRNGASMAFLDSPPGTANRMRVVEQLIQTNACYDYYAVHDSVRDAKVVYQLASGLGLSITAHIPSWRGLTFLSTKKDRKAPLLRSARKVPVAYSDIRFNVQLADPPPPQEERSNSVFLTLSNVGEECIPLIGPDALLFSMHFLDSEHRIILWDSPRYQLPVDLLPNESFSFWCRIPSLDKQIAFADCDLVKEGECWWSQLRGVVCPRLRIHTMVMDTINKNANARATT